MSIFKRLFYSYKKWLIAGGLFLILKLMLLSLGIILNLNFFQLFSLESDALSDLSVNDVYYRLRSRDSQIQHDYDNKEIVLVNSGDLDRRYFRLYLSELLRLVDENDPICIGVDHDFSNENKLGTDALISTIKGIDNIVVASKDKSKELNFERALGRAEFPKDQESIRYYYSNEQSFAYKIAQMVTDSVMPLVGDSFIINYQSYNGGLSYYNDVSADYYHTNFKYINALDLLSHSQDSTFLEGFLRDKVVILGHLGSICNDTRGEVVFDNSEFDIEDKFRVPCDLDNLYNREMKMYGAVIHANALANIINPSKRFYDLNGYITKILFNVLLLVFIFYAFFHSKGKAVNILILMLLSIPVLYFVLLLMRNGLYINAGISLLEFLFVEEFIEILLPLMLKFKFIRNEISQ